MLLTSLTLLMAGHPPTPLSRQTPVVDVVQKAGPAVVNIAAELVENPFSPAKYVRGAAPGFLWTSKSAPTGIPWVRRDH